MRDYLIRLVSDIRHRNQQGVDDGWAMGPFYPPADLPYTKSFEIKEWDSKLVRKAWADHAEHGYEYISVTVGTLTLVAGERTSHSEIPVVKETIEVPAGHSITLRPGFWRRFECSADATGISIRHPKEFASGKNDEISKKVKFEAYVDTYNNFDKIVWGIPVLLVAVSALGFGQMATIISDARIELAPFSHSQLVGMFFGFWGALYIIGAYSLFRIRQSHDSLGRDIASLDQHGYFKRRAELIAGNWWLSAPRLIMVVFAVLGCALVALGIFTF